MRRVGDSNSLVLQIRQMWCALPWAHFEVKAVEKLNLYQAMEQARRDCKSQMADGKQTKASTDAKALVDGSEDRGGKVPVVVHRRNFWPWLVTMEADTLFGSADGFLAGGCCFSRTESKRLNVHEAMEQAERDAKGRAAFLIHRKENRAWLATMTSGTFFRLLRGDIAGVGRLRMQGAKFCPGERTSGTQGTKSNSTDFVGSCEPQQ